MPNINSYIQELNRRKVFKSAGLYAFSSFIIMQVATLIVPALHLPEWTNTLILVLLVLGFGLFRERFCFNFLDIFFLRIVGGKSYWRV